MNDYRAYVECDYNAIYHHGVKGQKWGIRRYQNPDGSLTPEGRRHYGQLIRQYKKAGMTEQEIQAAIAKRNKIIKGAAAVAGAAALGAGAFYAHRYLGGKYLDRTLRAGQKIKTIGSDANRLKNQHFYGAKGLLDENKYIAELGEKKGFLGLPNGEFKKQITSQAKENIKIASEKSQRNIFKNLMEKDDDFYNAFKQYNLMPKDELIKGGFNKKVINGNDLAWKLSEGKLRRDQLTKKDWADLNTFYNFTQVGHANELKPLHDKYFNAMKKAGYGGMVDLNDSLNNSFHTKSAQILFDNDKLMQTHVKDLTAADINKARTIEMLQLQGEANLPYLPIMALTTGGLTAQYYDQEAMENAKKRRSNK